MTEGRAVGLYLHVPFCAGKCPYCDFYSLRADDETMDAYTSAVCGALEELARRFPYCTDTLYLGGGTPALLGARRITRLLECAMDRFGIRPGAEITVEANPETIVHSDGLLPALLAAGANRLSMGMQSAVAGELRQLGRRHGADDVRRAVEQARAAGFFNISLDLMLGIPQQTVETVENSVRFCVSLGVEHVSGYLLKIEEGTPFARTGVAALCPGEDEQADCYLHAVRMLEGLGYGQYEISNFSKPGCESRHNLKYWTCGEYLGVGPSAHSYLGGKRFYYPRELRAFLREPLAVVREEDDSPATLDALFPGEAPEVRPDFEEYAMLRLRLKRGLDLGEVAAFYPEIAVAEISNRARPMRRAGLLEPSEAIIALTPRGFLVSNAVIGGLLLF